MEWDRVVQITPANKAAGIASFLTVFTHLNLLGILRMFKLVFIIIFLSLKFRTKIIRSIIIMKYCLINNALKAEKFKNINLEKHGLVDYDGPPFTLGIA
ncbi:hypothetical protein BpHYR1_047560 [Brachionus plicatilis]|uniref:Uncharacterized protein n=1 Tax=Brachionus plicatilis TaxID=10195 RepID=A0A3M7SRZ0_BRAPC|nr:hypothetical protein BpHYR1_047560 [Brachionus plicatilis]